MKFIAVLGFLANILIVVQAQNLDYLDQKDFNAFFDVSYGEYDSNRLDLILPGEKAPHGLVIYIHGGGFIHDDKNELYERKDDINYFIENNIAVATINYRFIQDNDSLGVRLCLQDIQRAIQFIRFNASDYNIDKSRIGCYGVSAGAGSSLYFAFHDDMAIPGDSTLLGESTRIKCVGAISTQSTYNVFAWKKVIPSLHFIMLFKRKTLYNVAANFYGYRDYKSFKNSRKEITKSLDMLKMIDSDAPPVYLMNLMQETFPKNDGIIQHHRRHAIVLSKRLKKYNVENHLVLYKKKISPTPTIKEFMVTHLKL